MFGRGAFLQILLVCFLAAITLGGCSYGDSSEESPSPNSQNNKTGDSPPAATPPDEEEKKPGDSEDDTPPPPPRAEFCPDTEDPSEYPEKEFIGAAEAEIISYQKIQSALSSSCVSCHGSPANKGGFSYLNQLQGEEKIVSGQRKFIKGISEAAASIQRVIADGSMPPDRNATQTAHFESLAQDIQDWIDAGKPEQDVAKEGSDNKEFDDYQALKDCVPKPGLAGHDLEKDAFFASTNELPPTLKETDLFSIDNYDLAQKGTFRYSVEYPLWADNAAKGRWVHIPSREVGDGEYERERIEYDPTTKRFQIPLNTRFYKTFYRPVTDKSGKKWYRRIETRIIVVRETWEGSLYGTYVWSDNQQSAELSNDPYRDGTLFKDHLMQITNDYATGEKKRYALPGKHRCTECHMGSESESSIIGFSPLQLNRHREPIEGLTYLIEDKSEEEITQMQRFIEYGLFANLESEEELPKLEEMGVSPPKDRYELSAQAYATGNCYHCHNEKGFAFTPENGILFDTSPGKLFNFSTHERSVQIDNRKIVHHEGDLEKSQLWNKIFAPQEEQGLANRMPMHTPGLPDCEALKVFGQWIKSQESPEAAEAWLAQLACDEEPEFEWVEQDFTWPSYENYTPRRSDWKTAMPEKYRNLTFSDELRQAVQKEYAVGYWVNQKDDNEEPLCAFPQVDELPEEEQRPWMFRGRRAKRPFGEIFKTTPGAWYFTTTCATCHGNEADGNTSLARGILNWSGGDVRVANFKDGLFGKNGANLRVFDDEDRNYAGQYLIWMAMEGTTVQFPKNAEPFIGRHGAKMLYLVREKCLRQIDPGQSSKPFYNDHEIFAEVCFVGNRQKGDPLLEWDMNTGRPKHPEAIEEWADKAAFNAGWAIYDYLIQKTQGDQPIYRNDQCEMIYPKN